MSAPTKPATGQPKPGIDHAAHLPELDKDCEKVRKLMEKWRARTEKAPWLNNFVGSLRTALASAGYHRDHVAKCAAQPDTRNVSPDTKPK